MVCVAAAALDVDVNVKEGVVSACADMSTVVTENIYKVDNNIITIANVLK